MTELERNNRIEEELERISGFFEDLRENEKTIISPLIQNASFMRVTLDDLQEIIAKQGPVEGYQNGKNQYGVKQSAALQSYNSLVKNYAAVIKTLFGLLPPMKRETTAAALIPKTMTSEEWAEECRRAEERQKELNAVFDRAAEYQRRQREQEAKR